MHILRSSAYMLPVMFAFVYGGSGCHQHNEQYELACADAVRFYSDLYIEHRHDHKNAAFDAVLVLQERLGERSEPSCQTLDALGNQIIKERTMAGFTTHAGVIPLDTESFRKLTSYADKPVLVDFWAPWCGSCRRINPILDQIAAERNDVLITKINIDDHQDLAKTYGVRTIPTLLIFKTGDLTDRVTGARPKHQFDQFINRNL